MGTGPTPPPPTTSPRTLVIGRGRLGTAMAAGLARAGMTVLGPRGRGFHVEPAEADIVVLCVPDREIEDAAGRIARGPLVGHCSGASGLDVLEPHERFGVHPLMTFPADGGVGNLFAGAGCAVAGSSPRALAAARAIADHLGMSAFTVADRDRAAYHAAASVASNFLVTLEAGAERLAASAGVPRELLVPLVRATVEGWAAQGPQGALTGPVARGDEVTVSRQRAAVAERCPDLLELFDTLVACTRELACAPVAVAA